MTAPRYYLVTNDAPRAAREIWCHLGNLPPSISIADDFDRMMRIPDGTFYRCFWYGAREDLEPWENCWWSRKVKGGVEAISAEDWETICAWAERSRKAPALRLNFGIESEEEAAVGSPAASGNAAEPIPPAATIEQMTNPVKRSSKWT